MSNDINKWITDLIDVGIEDPIDQAGVLAQVKAESNFTPRSENLNYRADRLYAMFRNKFTDLDDAKAVVAQGQEAIGNRIYGGRMGNAADEGYKYRGRGYIQLTGKDNYQHYGDLIGEDLVADPDKANDPEIARKLAIAYLKENASGKLHDPYATTRAVGPAGWKGKVEERGKYQQEYFGKLAEMQERANLGPANPDELLDQALQEMYAKDSWANRPYELPAMNEYTIESGDNLTTIARKLGTTVSRLVEENNITNPNAIAVGQKLLY